MRWLLSLGEDAPVIEYCGGTEIGGAYITGTMLKPCVPGLFNTPALGLDVVILNDEGAPAEAGELFIVPPSIGLSTSLIGRDHHAAYYAGAPRGPQGEVSCAGMAMRWRRCRAVTGGGMGAPTTR